jgi:chromosome segregation ATPase
MLALPSRPPTPSISLVTATAARPTVTYDVSREVLNVTDPDDGPLWMKEYPELWRRSMSPEDVVAAARAMQKRMPARMIPPEEAVILLDHIAALTSRAEAAERRASEAETDAAWCEEARSNMEVRMEDYERAAEAAERRLAEEWDRAHQAGYDTADKLLRPSIAALEAEIARLRKEVEGRREHGHRISRVAAEAASKAQRTKNLNDHLKVQAGEEFVRRCAAEARAEAAERDVFRLSDELRVWEFYNDPSEQP